MNIEKAWYEKPRLLLLLSPFSALFYLISAFRRALYHRGLKKLIKGKVPVIVVGNIGVGGSGKTPVVIWLAQYLQKKGYKVGVVSRGYGGKAPHYPYLLSKSSAAHESGDEPLLIYRRLGIPVVVSPKRTQAIELMEEQGVDIILSDDGLQHYAMARDIELVVVDGLRRFGNGWLMPVGPLRELPSRLKTVPIVICNGGIAAPGEVQMQLEPGSLVNIKTGQRRVLQKNEDVIAIAGIGSPKRFFSTLSKMGADVIAQRHFQDHHQFKQSDFNGLLGQEPLLMTEKDAVKCANLVDENSWFLPVDAVMSESLIQKLELCLQELNITKM